jgi:hypothetical protein
MNYIRKLHEEAMDLAEMAFVARLGGDLEQADRLSRRAYEDEAKAARLMSDIGSPEPTRSVLYRSAASLALDCNEYREAERLIAAGLVGDPPEEIAEELRELFEKVNFQRLKWSAHQILSSEQREVIILELDKKKNRIEEELRIVKRLLLDDAKITIKTDATSHLSEEERRKRFLSAAGGWKDIVDEKFLDEIYRQRKLRTRPEVKL